MWAYKKTKLKGKGGYIRLLHTIGGHLSFFSLGGFLPSVRTFTMGEGGAGLQPVTVFCVCIFVLFVFLSFFFFCFFFWDEKKEEKEYFALHIFLQILHGVDK